MEAWLASPSASVLAEADGYWSYLAPLLREGRIAGPQVHDARIAALCKLHGVRELWTADRDFSRFGSLVCRNPLVEESAGWRPTIASTSDDRKKNRR